MLSRERSARPPEESRFSHQRAGLRYPASFLAEPAGMTNTLSSPANSVGNAGLEPATFSL